MKKVGIAIGILVLLIVGVACSIHRPLPEGATGKSADSLAKEMLQAIHFEAWENTPFVKWKFAGHHYVWDKHNNRVEVKWKKNHVLLHTKTVKGIAYNKSQKVEGEKQQKLIDKAWSYFCNDSFWLNAPAKAFDPGTERSIVEVDDGKKALLVQYASGGVTPGDAYLWYLDDTGLPYQYRMWVSIIPLGGVKATWEDWKETSTGAMLAQKHKMLFLNIPIENIATAQTLKELGEPKELFSELVASRKE